MQVKSIRVNGVDYVNVPFDGLVGLGLTESEAKIVIKDEEERIKSEQIAFNRQTAYKLESDPLYMEWQFDQTEESEQAWRDKVSEIKLRHPLTDQT